MASTSRLDDVLRNVSDINGYYDEAMQRVPAESREFVDTTSWAGELHKTAKLQIAKEQIKLLFLEVIGNCKHYDSTDGVVKNAFIEDKELRQLVEAL